MSKYRIPLVVDHASKKITSTSGKYRLPFKKDEPVEEREFALTSLPNEGFMVTSQVKLPHLSNNVDPYRTSKLEITPVSNLSLPQDSKREQVRQPSEMGKQSNRSKSLIKSVTAREKDKTQEIVSARQKDVSELDQVKEIVLENDKGDSKMTRSKAAISQYGNKRRRYLSTASKYADDQGTNTEYSQTDFDYRQSRKKAKQEKEKSKEPLPTIGEKLKKKTEVQEEDEQPLRLNIWDSLSKDIAEYRQAKRRQQIIRKKSKNKRKFSRSLSKRHKSSNEVEIIEEELKRLNQQSSRQLLKKDIYEEVEPNREDEFVVGLPGIKKDAKKQNQAATNFIERLKMAIEFKKEKPKKGKQKLPLQFYINSYEEIREINPFFRKINQLGGCILLSIGKLTVYQPDKYIYSEGDILKNIYIIIYGKVFLSNKHKTLKKFALTGETLGQQQLFEQPKSYIQRLQEGYKTQYYRQDARSLNKCCLLTISLKKYYKMYRQLQKMGYKQLFNLIDNLFRINYINKQANQHHQTRQRVPTEILIQKPNRKHSFFH